MMSVFQIAFVGLIIMEDIQPLLAWFAHIGFVNGFDAYYNTNRNSNLHAKTITQGTLPYRITAIGYDAQLVYSFNMSLLLMVLPMIGWLVGIAKYRSINGKRFRK